MKNTIEQRVETLEKQLATLSSVVGKAGSPKKDWLKMARRQAMTVCKRFGSDRPSPRVERYVDDRRDSQDAFARQ